MAIAPALLPELLAILKSDEYGAALQRRALSILHTILEVLQAHCWRLLAHSLVCHHSCLSGRQQ